MVPEVKIRLHKAVSNPDLSLITIRLADRGDTSLTVLVKINTMVFY